MPAIIPRHSREVQEIVEALDARLHDADNVVEKAWDKVTPDELAYIDRELERVLTDRRYYLENYHVITDENGRLQTLYPFWDHQEIIFAQLQLEWEANGRFRGIILKPRQCGGTVWSAGITFHATIFTPQAFTLMMAHDDEASAEIDRRIRVAFDNLPWWMRPDLLSRQAERHWIFQRPSADQRATDPGLGSTLLVSNAQRKAGIAIGRTVRCAHFSEVSRWPDASIYTADIKPSMNAKDMLAIMESTAYGRNGLFFNQWNAAEKGKSVWTPIFIPVYRVRKYYLPLLKTQSFTLTPEEKALKLAVKAKEDFVIPNSFFNWRRQDILETINSTGSDEDHYEAYPTTSIEAFISSGFCAFPKKQLNHQARANCCNPIAIGEIEYNGADADPILRLHTPTDEELLEKPDRINRLWLWEYPDPNDAVEYYGSGDVAGGSGPDFSDGVFYRLPCGPHDKMVQVAEWHGLCNPSHFARIMAALGYWYHTAELAIEYMKAGITTGDELLHQLDYPNLYRWKHMDKISSTMTLHVHWMTTSRTRDDAINRMNERLIDDTIVIRNKHTIEEMRDFGRLEGDGKAAGLDNNDDMVMGHVINICAAHQSGRESSEPASGSSAHAHLLPTSPRVWGIYDHLMRQIDQVDSEEVVKKVMADAAKKYNGRVEDIEGKRNLIDTHLSTIGWVVKLPNQMMVVSAREIQVMQANTPWSPIYDTNGAEHDLHFRQGIPTREMMPEVVQLYRAILTAQHYEGDD